jgi:hypothetical protein
LRQTRRNLGEVPRQSGARVADAKLFLDFERVDREQTHQIRTNEPVIPGDVEHADDPRRERIADRRGGAREIGPAVAKVLGRHELDGPAVGQRGADGIGSGCGFAPITARNEVDAFEPATDVAIARDAQDAPVFIRQHHGITGVGKMCHEPVDHRTRRAQQRLVRGVQFAQLGIA